MRRINIVKWITGCLVLTIIVGAVIILVQRHGTVSIKEINLNPDAYMNQQVTVIAWVFSNVAGMGMARDDEGFQIFLVNLPSGFWPLGDEYKIVGKVVQTEGISLAIEVSGIDKT